MEYNELFKKAKEELKYADHILFVSYPLIKDTALLLNSLNHLSKCFIYAVNSFLDYKRKFKLVKALPSKDEIRVEYFLEKFGKKYKLEKIKKLWELEIAKRNAMMSVKKEEKFVFILKDYRTVSFDYSLLKEFSKELKIFLEIIENSLKSPLQ